MAVPDQWLQLAHEVQGDFAEFGVFRGSTLIQILKAAKGRTVHGFDSWLGMEEPGPFDTAKYWKGKFSLGGSTNGVKRRLGKHGFLNGYHLHQGFFPSTFDDALSFCFCYIDVDHYQPTVLASQYAFSHMPVGGILGFDDVFDKAELASRAVKEFMVSYGDLVRVLSDEDHQLWLQKLNDSRITFL